MVEVDNFDERLDFRALGNALLRHAVGDLLGVAVDTGHQSVAEGVGLRTLIKNCVQVAGQFSCPSMRLMLILYILGSSI